MGEYFRDNKPTELKGKSIIALWVAIFFFFLLIARLWYLQIIKANYFKELSLTNRIRIAKAYAPRGYIFDRTGQPVAETRPGFDLHIIAEDIPNLDKTIESLSKLIGMDESSIRKKIEEAKSRASSYSIKIKEDMDWDEMSKISLYEYELPGVAVEVSPKRTYLHNKAIAHLLGYLGEMDEAEFSEFKKKEDNPYGLGDIIGKYGLEASVEDVLKGKDGGRQIEVDAFGTVMRVIKNIPPYPGNNVRLTIDLKTQKAAFEAMEGKAGAVVAMDPTNGKLIAMVSVPSFDPNMLTNDLSNEEWNSIVTNPMKVLNNRAIQGQYPPASTFKPITAAAALEQGIIKPATMIHAGPSFWFGGREYRDWKEKGHGTINVHKAIVESSDTFFYQVGLKTGIENIARYSKKFGFGNKTGIELKGEKSGLVPNSAWKRRSMGQPWYEGETISVAVGQGYMLTTPLQLLTAYSAIANGGTLYAPLFIEEVLSPEGEIIRSFSPVEKGSIGISKETMTLLQDALKGVVEEEGGTARSLFRDDLKIAGKTGTAQVIKLAERTKDVSSIPYNRRDHAWFVGFAPYDNPKIAVSVLVEHGGFGASAAAPVALKVIKAYLEETSLEKQIEGDI